MHFQGNLDSSAFFTHVHFYMSAHIILHLTGYKNNIEDMSRKVANTNFLCA